MRRELIALEKNIEELLRRIEFKKKFVEEYYKKCLDRADVFSTYKELTHYCEAKIEAYNIIIDDIHELFPSAKAITKA